MDFLSAFGVLVKISGEFARVRNQPGDFQDLPKSAMFKTMGYSPGLFLENRQFSTLVNSAEIDTNSRPRSKKYFRTVLEAF